MPKRPTYTELEARVKELENQVAKLSETTDSNAHLPDPLQDNTIGYENLFSKIVCGIVITNTVGTILDWNDYLEQLTGLSKTAVKGKLIWEILLQLIPEEVRNEEYLHEIREQFLRENAVFEWDEISKEILICSQEGQQKYIKAASFTLDTPDGKRYVSVINDESEQKFVEFAYEQQLRRYINIINSSNDIMFTLNYDEVITDILGSWTSNFGLSKNELLGKRFLELVHDNAYFHEGFIKRALRGNKVIYECSNIFSDLDKHYQLSLSPLLNEAHVEGILLVGRDITRLKKNEMALKESELRLKAIFSQDQSVKLLINPDSGQIEDANPSACVFYGYSLEELKNMNISEINILSFADIKAEMNLARNTNKNYFNFKHKLANGEVHDVEVYSTPIHYGQHQKLFSIIHDITERKQAEAELRELNTQLKELIATKDKFFSIIAHDLKSPFNVILGFGELLIRNLEKKDYNKLGKFAENIQSASVQAYDLLINLLEWSRMQTGKLQFKPTKFNINDMIDSIVSLCKYNLAQKNIDIQVQVNPELTLYADQNMIHTILRNLLTNAIKFTNTNGTISIVVENLGFRTEICVIDNGVGMTEQQLNNLFRIDNNTTLGTSQEKGTGLGLILCREFVERHGGTIHVKSTKGKGSEFIVSIPNALPDE